MKHLNDGIVRRSIDEPFALTDSQRRHLATCAKCGARLSRVDADAHLAGAVFAMADLAVDQTGAGVRLQDRLRADRAGRRAIRPARFRARSGSSLGVAAAVLAVAAAVGFTPAGSLAQSFVTIFQPNQVSAIPITSLDIRSLLQLRHFGEIQVPGKMPGSTAVSATAASVQSGMKVLVPVTLPAGVPSSVTYSVTPGATGSFTFSAAKAEAWAHTHGKSLPVMPKYVNGTVITLTVGAAVVATYGGCAVKCTDLPSLIIGQTVAPRIASSRANLKELEDYVLALPGVSAQFATELRSIGDPTSTLPLPIPTAFVHATPVQIAGVQGEEIGDQTGVGSLIVWERDGIIYAVGGALPMSQVESVAQGLH